MERRARGTTAVAASSHAASSAAAVLLRMAGGAAVRTMGPAIRVGRTHVMSHGARACTRAVATMLLGCECCGPGERDAEEQLRDEEQRREHDRWTSARHGLSLARRRLLIIGIHT